MAFCMYGSCFLLATHVAARIAGIVMVELVRVLDELPVAAGASVYWDAVVLVEDLSCLAGTFACQTLTLYGRGEA